MQTSAPLIRVPAEWAPQRAIWTAWPHDAKEWNGDLASPRRDVAALAKALAAHGNTVRLLVMGEEAEASARALVGTAANITPATYGDIWLRDTGPIFARINDEPAALCFKTNSWGGKFELPEDAGVGKEIANLAGVPHRAFDFVLEGGAIDHDGEGTVIATKQTLLNENRNAWTAAEAEAALKECLGAQKVIWIGEGLLNDHTDGHVDNIARFVAPGRVVCQAPFGSDDPNAVVLETIAQTLRDATDARGRRLEVSLIPSVGRILDGGGQVLPASYMNFVIANRAVIVPVYGTRSEADALEMLQAQFPGRTVVGLSSFGLIGSGDAGGGSFHCITQQEPL